MKRKPAAEQTVSSLADLVAVAYQIEVDAVERYGLLADQMETHNNAELAGIFRDLARAEGIHAEEIRRMAGNIDISMTPKAVKFRGESPEEVDLGGAHYRMTPWHALQLALDGEKRALAYFKSITEKAKDSKVKEMAAELMEEEAEHVNLVHRLLRRYPQPDDTWADDPDPPAPQD
jgi:rubrerythrin